MNIDYLSLFIRIVQVGSLAAAAREADLSPTTVSERLAALESYYGVTLLDRSTRSLHLTDEGRIVLDGAYRIVSDARKVSDDVRRVDFGETGLIRFSMPTDLGERVVMPAVDRYLETHPGVAIDVVISDEPVNLVRQGMDFAVRDGAPSDDGLAGELLTENPRVVVAAPDYIARRGAPMTPGDLLDHDCLALRTGALPNRYWRFLNRDVSRPVAIAPSRTTNNAKILAQWCKEGRGIAIKSLINVVAEIRAGTLVPLLERHMPAPGAFYLVFPAGSPMRPRAADLASVIGDAVIEAGRDASSL